MTGLILGIILNFQPFMELSTDGDKHVDNSATASADSNMLTPVTQSIGVRWDNSLDKLCTPL